MQLKQDRKTYIKEIFTSIQGEGIYVGSNHVFVRFTNCNLSCKYCDTDFNGLTIKEYDIDKLYKTLKPIDCDMISFTGGEPLLEVSFLKEFLSLYKEKLDKKIYLETNGTLYQQLEKIIDYIDIISMDIKLKSSSGACQYKENELFLDVAYKNKKEIFIKIVFDKNIKEEEIKECTNLAKKYNSLIILQPKMPLDKDFNIYRTYLNFYSLHKNTRLIPQVHKFLNLA